VSTRVAQIINATKETSNPACTDLLMNSDDKPKSRSVWPSLLGYRSSRLYSCLAS